MQSFDILDPELDIFQSRVLEASAGTGKTFAIEHLVVRLLIESPEPIHLKEILAVTFTRDATRDLKERIRAKIEEKLRCGEGNPLRLHKAIAEIDEMQVFTIHGFCQRMLTEFAFEARRPLTGTGSAETEATDAIRLAILDFLRTGDTSLSSDVTALIQRERYDIPRLVNKIAQAMQAGIDPLPIPGIGEIPPIRDDTIVADFAQLAPRYKRMKLEEAKEQFAPFSIFLETRNPSLLLAEKEWFFEKMHEENAKVRAAPLSSLSLKNPTFWPQLHEAITPHLQIARDPSQMLRRVASSCRALWEAKAKSRDLASFDDLLRNMQEALRHESFAAKVRQKYRAVVIDEFQDTDPLQWEIFSKLFLSTHLLYLVGDPKQSIYGFRSADIYTYMQAVEAMGAEKKGHLVTNYRSSPLLIDQLNALFTHVPGWLDLPSCPGSLSYTPVRAGRTEAKLSRPPIIFWHIAGDPGRERSWPTKGIESNSLFPAIASEIITLHQDQGVPLAEMVVLVKDRFQAFRLQAILEKWNIPSRLRRTENLTHTRGFAILEMLLQATLNPENKQAARALFFSGLVTLEPTEDCPSFVPLREAYDEGGASALFDAFFALKLHEDETVHERIHAHASSRLLLEFRQAFACVLDLPAMSLEELIEEVSRLKQKSPDEDERLAFHPDGDEEQVAIMTTFASKGLEFDIVFALGLASRSPLQESNPERDAEKMRQLYVGLTRAKEKLYIPYLEDVREKQIPSGVASPLELFFAPWDPQSLREKGLYWTSELPYRKAHETTPAMATLQKPPALQAIFPQLHRTSFSSMVQSAGHTSIGERFAEQNLSQKTAHTLPVGAETGTLLHTLLEKTLVQTNTSIEQLVAEELAHTHLMGWEEVVTQMVRGVFDYRHPDGFHLVDLTPGEYMTEMEFLYPNSHYLIKGFADLIFQKLGRLYILDWKTNWLGPTEADYTDKALEAAMREHDYFLQASIYTEALSRYVKQFYTAPFEEIFGGAIYLFVRGKAGYTLRPDGTS